MNTPKTKGSTVLELLLYTGIVTILLIGIGAVSASALEMKARSFVVEEVRYAGTFATERITRSIRESSGITAPALGATGTSVVLAGSAPENDPTEIALLGGRLLMTRGSAPSVYLTPASVVISEVEFTHLGDLTQPGSVAYSFRVTAGGDIGVQYRFTETYSGAVVPRISAFE